MSIPANGEKKLTTRKALPKAVLSPCAIPVTFKFWSDTNQTLFIHQLQYNDVRFTFSDNGIGELFVYDDGQDIHRMAVDLGADKF